MLRGVVSVVAGLVWASSALAADVSLLNVSYDPTRELYVEFNKAFAAAYQKQAGLKVDCWPSEAVLRSLSAAR